MAYDITLEGKNLKEAERLLEKTIRIFDECNINYWLEGGTLLGIRRENRLLPWDNDMDISLMSDEKHKFSSLFKTLKKSGLRVRIRYFKRDSEYFKAGDIRIIKIRTSHLFGLIKGKVCLDVFVKYNIGSNTYWKIRDLPKNVPSIYYRDFKKITFNNYEYSIPELTDEYLTYRYGDWQTPKKDWDTFSDDRALKKGI